MIKGLIREEAFGEKGGDGISDQGSGHQRWSFYSPRYLHSELIGKDCAP